MLVVLNNSRLNLARYIPGFLNIINAKSLMKTVFLFLGICFTNLTLNAQTKLNPVIKDFGSLYDVPMAKVKADTTIEYKIVVEFRQAMDKPNEMHQTFEHIGRMYNLHIHDKVPQKKLHVVVVIFGPAAFCVLNNEAYKAKFKVDNPNLKVFEAFKKAGIRTVVCGQSVMVHGIDPATISSDVELASSRFVAVSTCQMNGYALFQMN
jgi:intracellular sulfur oxidation DsrE/DsrF family protein